MIRYVGEKPQFSFRDLQKCAERELAMRRAVFAKRGMTEEHQAEIAKMSAIAEHFRNMADAPKPGPTGDYPHGKLAADDRGGINIAITGFNAPDGERMVRLDFGYPIDWLAVPSEQALVFAEAVTMKARQG